MDINPEKLNVVFHDLLNVIKQLKEIDMKCNKQNCNLRKKVIHKSLLECQTKIQNMRKDLLEALEET